MYEILVGNLRLLRINLLKLLKWNCLKWKSGFSGDVYFEPVCTLKVLDALIYLKNNNNFFSNIRIYMENMLPEFCDLNKDEEIRIELVNESDTEGQEKNLNRLDNFSQVA